ncbi:flagellar hook-basal body complex protein [Hungatella hathewayi]|uniref:flagellar hook-basal body complex protein n=1 Tax=Hungatella hathewayi TaxID=154046 RepID=UPI0035656C99
MLRSMDSAVSGLRAHQNKMDVIGNNIANVNTFGFKAQNFTFKEAMYQTSAASTGGGTTSGGTNAAQFGYGSTMGAIDTDMGAGTPSTVGGLNAFIDGEGFFITYAKKVEGGVAPADMKNEAFDYTRVGQFKIDGNGYLTDANGNFVYGFQPDNASDPKEFGGTDAKLVPLQAPKDLEGYPAGDDDKALQMLEVSIDKLGHITGTIKSDDPELDGKNVSLGKVAIATFQNPNGLAKAGGGYYNTSTGDNSGAASASVPGGSTATLSPGALEGSNVDLAKEFAEMITTQRGFQANSKIITVSDEMLTELVNMKR